MVETEAEGMEAEAANGIVTIAILDIATDGVAEVGSMDTDLILSTGLKFELNQRMSIRAGKDMIVGDGILASVVVRRAVGEVSAVVFEPALYRALILLHDTREHSHIAAVEDDIVPVGLEEQLRLLVLGIDHQSTRIAVETMHDMSRTMLARLTEIVVEDCLDVERTVARSHRENARFLVDDDEIAVFVDDMHVAVLELHILLRLAHGDLHARLQGKVELGHDLVVDFDAMTGERSLHLRATLVEMRQQPVEELCGLLNGVTVETLLRLLTDSIM